jgi:hypothetical protein
MRASALRHWIWQLCYSGSKSRTMKQASLYSSTDHGVGSGVRNELVLAGCTPDAASFKLRGVDKLTL